MNDNPAGYVRDLELRDLAADAMRDDLKVYVKKHGNIDLGDGRFYGVKPPSGRQTFGVIEPKADKEE